MSNAAKLILILALALLAYGIYKKLGDIQERLDGLSKKPTPEPSKEPEGPVYDVSPEVASESPFDKYKSWVFPSENNQNPESVPHSDISPEKAIVPVGKAHSDSDSESILHSGQNAESTPELFITEDYRLVIVKGEEKKASPTQGRVIARLWENMKKGIKDIMELYWLQ